MVWLHDPIDAQPIARVVYPAVRSPGWTVLDVWIGPNGTRPTVSYVRTGDDAVAVLRLERLIKDAVTRQDAAGQPTISRAGT